MYTASGPSAESDGLAGDPEHPQGTQADLSMHLFRGIGGRVALAQHVRGEYILPELSFNDSVSTSTGVFHIGLPKTVRKSEKNVFSVVTLIVVPNVVKNGPDFFFSVPDRMGIDNKFI
jgi:hypothetical protein